MYSWPDWMLANSTVVIASCTVVITHAQEAAVRWRQRGTPTTGCSCQQADNAHRGVTERPAAIFNPLQSPHKAGRCKLPHDAHFGLIYV